MKESIGNRIRRVRQQKAMTLEDLAQKSKVSIGHLSTLERSTTKRPGERVISRVSVALGVPVAYLIGETKVQPGEFHPHLERLSRLLENDQVPKTTKRLVEDLLTRFADLVDEILESQIGSKIHDSNTAARMDKSIYGKKPEKGSPIRPLIDHILDKDQ